MELLVYTLVILITIFIVNYFLNKNGILQSLTGDNHQLFVEKKNIPLSGGLFIFIFSLFFLDIQKELLYFSIIFFIGLMSDLKFLKSAKIRFLLQVICISFLVVKFDLSLNDLRIEYFNLLLNYKIFSFIFFIFCILIVTNGTNFIDGLNGLVIGYYTIVIVTLFNLGLLDQIENTRLVIFNYLILFISLFLFNIFNKLYLGDSGSYFVGFVFGALLILVYKEFSYFSPFFIVLLLWYPCFENLFSIIRKYKFNLSPLRADNKHLHHLLFYFMKKKFNLSAIFANNSASILINLVNLIFIAAGANFIHNSLVQIILILALIIFYCLSYLVLFNFRYKKNN